MSSSVTIRPLTHDTIVRDLKELGVRSGDLLNLKVSMRSVGYVVGGPRTLVDALVEVVGPEGTLVTDSFVNVYPLPLSARDARRISDRYTPSYAGALANVMIQYPGSHRSLHPVQRFVAVGRMARELMEAHTEESYAYDVLRAMAESGVGRNLKIGTDAKVVGVGTTHVAIGLLGFHEKRRMAGVNYYDGATGTIKLFERNWSGGCAVGFNNFMPLYREAGAILSEGKVGDTDAKITDMKKTLEVEMEVLKKNPAFFFCDDPACEPCRLHWDFSTGSRSSVRYHKAKNRFRRFRQIGLRGLIARAAGA